MLTLHLENQIHHLIQPMKDIKCPNCGTTFHVDDTLYAAILEQIRTSEFNKEIERRMAEVREQFKTKEETVRTLAERAFEQRLSDKNLEMSQLQNEVTRLKGVIAGFDATMKSEISAIEAAQAKMLFEAVSSKDKVISELQGQIASSEEAHKVAILEERNALADNVREMEKKIIELELKLKADRLAAENRENQLREHHQLQLRDMNSEIDRLKDFKLRLSTKMVGETLEQHCSILFDQARSMGMYPDARFEKDNTAVEHSKGDFIFRDYIDGCEYVSIMFEMKNEMDATATKHRNDDFLEKLDKDRQRKGCEYAVLVSMLEQDNEMYNAGIVDKSYRYPKMIVIRPQFFLPVLRLICEASKKGFIERRALVQELELARNQTIDFAKFEERINRFRTTFSNNVTTAHKKFMAAYDGIDKIIESLERQIKALRDVKANFEASDQKLLKADEMVGENLTVKKLTHGNPSIRKMIEDAREEN